MGTAVIFLLTLFSGGLLSVATATGQTKVAATGMILASIALAVFSLGVLAPVTSQTIEPRWEVRGSWVCGVLGVALGIAMVTLGSAW